ncbi:MAG: hypothetical protein JO110_29745 [Acetobacteraceae bacterium]|nr:hypothetical protein [Acetobacteraceae bacterium]
MAGPIDVCLTVDVEFSLGSAFSVQGAEPIGDDRVYCRVGGREWGLGFLLKTFAQYGINATFFVEALHPNYFGYAPMERAVQKILRAGHDVQLHLHPQWLFFADPHWRRKTDAGPPNDDLHGRSEDEVVRIIEMGLAAFARWNAPRPIALRTGRLRADRAIYRAMARTGIRLSSNIGWGWFQPAEQELRISAGRAWIEGVLEAPVMTYRQFASPPLKPLRLFTVTSTSVAEARSLLDQAWQAQISPVVILTHPFEFVRYFGSISPVTASRINVGRLEALCRKIANEPERFRSRSFSGAAEDWTVLPALKPDPLRPPAIATAARLVSNKINDTISWL